LCSLHSHYYFAYFALHATTTSALYTLSLHDALPISIIGSQTLRPKHTHLTVETARSQRTHTSRSRHTSADDRQTCGFNGQVSVLDRKSTRLNSSHVKISYAVFCLKKKNEKHIYIIL